MKKHEITLSFAGFYEFLMGSNARSPCVQTVNLTEQLRRF